MGAWEHQTHFYLSVGVPNQTKILPCIPVVAGTNRQRKDISLTVLMIKDIILLNLLLLNSAICIAQQNNIDTLHTKHQKTHTAVLKDSDHDGVTDQLDKEPATPAGCPVDTHGVMLDTDGDGIPDCRDKEKLSRADCFPADSNGIVTCPELNCCDAAMEDYLGCAMPDLPSFQFKPAQQTLQQEEPLLDSLARTMMNHPVCSITLQGYHTLNNKTSYKLTETRIQNIVRYITGKWGVSAERFTISIKPGTYINAVNLIHN